MKKKKLKSANRGRAAKKNKYILVISFAITASLVAVSAFAAIIPPDKGGGQAVKPPGSTSPSPPSTQPNGTGSSENTPSGGSNSNANQKVTDSEQKNVTTGVTTNCSGAEECLTSSPITKDLNQIINFLSAGVAIIIIGVIVFGGIQYTAAGNKPEAVAAARSRISNALMAFGAFLLIFAFLQWLIPGGIFG